MGGNLWLAQGEGCRGLLGVVRLRKGLDEAGDEVDDKISFVLFQPVKADRIQRHTWDIEMR